MDSKTGGCVFCVMPEEKIVAQTPLAYAVLDNSPVTPLHTLILTRRHVRCYFDLETDEKQALDQLIDKTRRAILLRDMSVAGFNIGINIGKVAGQTIFHCRVHLIPRQTGDALYPEGGIHAAIRQVLGRSG